MSPRATLCAGLLLLNLNISRMHQYFLVDVTLFAGFAAVLFAVWVSSLL